ncbi:unnamed protein product [Ixodes persulcatus]
MGLSDAVYWTGHYLSFLVLILAESSIVLVYMVTIKQSDLGVVFLENTAVSLLLVAFLIYCLLLPLLILLLSCVSPKGVYASLLGLAFYLVLPFIQLDAISWIRGSVGDYIFFGRSTKLLSCIFPQLGICLVLQGISLENDYRGTSLLCDSRHHGVSYIPVPRIQCLRESVPALKIRVIWHMISGHNNYWQDKPPKSYLIVENSVQNCIWAVFEISIILNLDTIKNTSPTTANSKSSAKICDKRLQPLYTEIKQSLCWNLLEKRQKCLRLIYVALWAYSYRKRSLHPATTSSAFIILKKAEYTIIYCFYFFYFLCFVLTVWDSNVLKQEDVYDADVDRFYAISEIPCIVTNVFFFACLCVREPAVSRHDHHADGRWLKRKAPYVPIRAADRRKGASPARCDEDEAKTPRICDVAGCSSNIYFPLKEYNFGVGYQLRILKKPGTFALLTVLNIIKKTAPNAEENEKQNEVIVALNTLSHRGFISMFKELELHQSTLGIRAIGVTVATMRDVYVK